MNLNYPRKRCSCFKELYMEVDNICVLVCSKALHCQPCFKLIDFIWKRRDWKLISHFENFLLTSLTFSVFCLIFMAESLVIFRTAFFNHFYPPICSDRRSVLQVSSTHPLFILLPGNMIIRWFVPGFLVYRYTPNI